MGAATVMITQHFHPPALVRLGSVTLVSLPCYYHALAEDCGKRGDLTFVLSADWNQQLGRCSDKWPNAIEIRTSEVW